MAPIALPFAVLEDLGGDAERRRPRDRGRLGRAGVDAALRAARSPTAARASARWWARISWRRSRRARSPRCSSPAARASRVVIALHAVSARVRAALPGGGRPGAAGRAARTAPDRERAGSRSRQATAFGLGAAAGGLIARVRGRGHRARRRRRDASPRARCWSRASAAPPAAAGRAREPAARPPRGLARVHRAHLALGIVLQFSVMLMGWFGAWAVVGPVVAKRVARRRRELGLDRGRAGPRPRRRRRRGDARPLLAADARGDARVLRRARSSRCCSSRRRPSPRSRSRRSWRASASRSSACSGTPRSTRASRPRRCRASRSYDVLGSIALVPLRRGARGLGRRGDRRARDAALAAAASGGADRRGAAVPEVRHLRNTK